MRQPFFIDDATQNAFDAADCSKLLCSFLLLCLCMECLYEVNVVDSIMPNWSANNERTAADTTLRWHVSPRTYYLFYLHLLLFVFFLHLSLLQVMASLQGFFQVYSQSLKVKSLAFGALMDVGVLAD